MSDDSGGDVDWPWCRCRRSLHGGGGDDDEKLDDVRSFDYDGVD